MTWKPSIKPQKLISDDYPYQSIIGSNRGPSTEGRELLKNSGELGDSFSDPYVSVSKYLASLGITELDVWNATPKAVDAYKSMKDKLNTLFFDDNNFISVGFEACEELKHIELQQTPPLKVDKDRPIYQVIALVCKKYNIESPKNFSFKSPGGSILDNELPLSTYGFGSILKEWKLTLCKSLQSTTRQVKAKTCVVIFLFPRISYFKGLEKRAQKIQNVTPVGQIIQILCKKYEIPDPENYALTTKDGFEFSNKESLGYYGLGTKFDFMTVLFVPRNKEIKPRHISQEFAWTQVSEEITIDDSRRIFLDMDQIIVAARDENSKLTDDNRRLRLELNTTKKEKAELEKEKTAIEANFENLRKQAKQLVDTYTKLKEHEAGLIQEKGELSEQINDLRNKNFQCIEVIKKLKKIIDDKDSELTAQKFEYENEIMNLEQKNVTLENYLNDENRKNLELVSKQIMLQDDIDRLNVKVESQRIELTQLQDKLSQKTQKENELQSELSKLNKDITFMQFNEKQNKELIENLKREKESLNEKIKEITSEKQSLQSQLLDLKQKSDIEINGHKETIAGLEKKLEQQIEDNKSVVNSFEEQIRGLKKSLETTASSQSGLQQENTTLKEQVIELKSELESIKREIKNDANQVKSLTEENEALRNKLQTIQKDNSENSQLINTMKANYENEKAEKEKLKATLDSINEKMSKEQKSLIELQQERNELDSKCKTLESQVTGYESKLKELKDKIIELQANQTTKSSALDKETFNELNKKITKLTEDKQALEKELKDYKEKNNHLKEEQSRLKSLSQELQSKLDALIPSPPPPPLKTLTPDDSKKKTDKNSQSSLESQILSIKDTLQKTVIQPKEKSNTPIEGSMAAILINGLRQKFKRVKEEEMRDYEDLDALDDDRFFITNDQEEDWD